MPLPEKLLFALPELADKWALSIDDLGMYAFEGILTLAVIVREVQIVRREHGAHRARISHVKGVVSVDGADVWPAFKGEPVTLTRVATSDGELEELSEETRPRIILSDLYVRREEKQRFERENNISPAATGTPPAAAARKSGAPTVILWTRFWINLCVRIYNHGIPETAAELIRESLEWFVNNTDHIPDESYIRRNIKALMAALRAS